MGARRSLIATALAVLVAIPVAGAAALDTPGPATGLTDQGRKLDPIGRMTPLGAFPTGGALSPDGRFYWAVDAGRGPNAVRVIDVASGKVRQTLPIPGGYVGVAFAPDGKRAYVSGQKGEGTLPAGIKGTKGDVIHVYAVNGRTGHADELDPIVLPKAQNGAAAFDELPPVGNVNAWPEGLDVTPDNNHLVVALGQADQAAIINLKTGQKGLTRIGAYPYAAVTDPHRRRAYVTNERDGTVSVLSLPVGKLLATIRVRGRGGAGYAHPQGMVADPIRDRLYVAITERDQIAVIDTARMVVERYVDVSRKEGAGTGPVSLAVDPDGQTLYSANSGEDAIVAIALAKRPPAAAKKRKRVVKVKSVKSIRRYRVLRLRALRTSGTHARYVRNIHRLQRRYLRGRVVRSCLGPTRRQEARWVRAVLRAHGRTYRRAIKRARARLPKVRCPDPGYLPNAPEFSILGRMPTAAYPTDVAVSRKKLVWLAAKGLGVGPNTGADHDISRLLKGRAGVTKRPTDKQFAAYTKRATKALIPTNFSGPPPNTPIVGPGGPSDKIKYIFYVVKENRTYDQIYGSDPRGRGAANLQVFDDNGVPGPTGGVTPNAHALSRKFQLMDNVYANSEESTVGHKIAAGGRVNDYTQRYVNTGTGRGRKGNPDIFSMGLPSNAFVFDQAVRQRLSFRIYGELGAGNQPLSNDNRPTFPGVLLGLDPSYPTQISGGCLPTTESLPVPVEIKCTADSGDVGLPGVKATHGPPSVQSRIRSFSLQFAAQTAAGVVPHFNYFSLFNDHTSGTIPGLRTPKAQVADNDLALGQLVELVSNSPIWSQSVIFVTEDDSQSGIDSVDAHRIPAMVISPWAKRGGVVVSTRYDQYSFLRTAEMIAGLRPLHLGDALATPMYDAFISGDEKPDVEGTRFHAIQPDQPLNQLNPANAPDAKLSAQMPFDHVDLVPQEISDRLIWRSVFGAGAAVPVAGPNSSRLEHARTTGVMRALGSARRVLRFLLGHSQDEDPSRTDAVASLLSTGAGLTPEEARERLEQIEGEGERGEEAEEDER